MPNVFAVPIFFIVFRETLETAIVVSVLLAFLKQQLGPDQNKTVYRKLRNQVWLGTFIGFGICFVIGCGIIGAFYGLGTDHWAGTEEIWEGVFALLASLIISIMGLALLRVSKMQAKWRVKLAKALEAKDSTSRIAASRFSGRRIKLFCEKYAMFMLPFVTILREGLEAVIFIGGVSLGLPASSIPLPTICGLLAGSAIGFLIYKGGNRMPLQIFLIASTCFLYLVAAGLFTRAIGYFEANTWNELTGGDAAENGVGPGSYDIRQSVWHLNCCSPELGGGSGWGVFNALFGWTNSATYGTVIGYNLYWIAVIMTCVILRFKEKNGRYPLMKARTGDVSDIDSTAERKNSESGNSSSDNNVVSHTVLKTPGDDTHNQSSVGVRDINDA